MNSLGSSDKEKNGKSSNERSKDHGSVRKKGRPKSQDMSDLIGADIQIERGACNTKGEYFFNFYDDDVDEIKEIEFGFGF